MFVKGQEYLRNNLLEFTGSKQTQTGIIWGAKEPGCVIVTSGGRHGKKAGYEDKQHLDGTWTYFGQGEEGDHNPNKYSNKLLVNKERSVLLFSTREPSAQEVKKLGSWKKVYTYQGIFEVISCEVFTPTEGTRKGNRLLKFLLAPATNILENNIELQITATLESNLKNLRDKIQNSNPPASFSRITLKEYRIRSQEVKIYALSRARGICELCEREAPFLTGANLPFLEVHHILRLADDGPDLPTNVAAICPNCHREAHFGMNRVNIKDKLIKIIKAKETSLV